MNKYNYVCESVKFKKMYEEKKPKSKGKIKAKLVTITKE
jgi:hypothetical protein